MLAAFIGLTAFAAEEKSLCPAGTLADGKVTHELECCTIVQEQGTATSALTVKTPWAAPAGSLMTITPKEGVIIQQLVVNIGNTTYATWFSSATLTNATMTKQNNIFTITVTDGTAPVVINFVKTSQFKELTVTYTQEGGSVTPEPEDPVIPEPEDTTVVTPEPQPTTETVYFINNKGWAKVNAYAWTTTPIVAWPGAAATKESEQIGGYDVYSYTLEASAAANVIFNNGSGQQTADLKWTAGKYVINNQWYTKEEAEAQLAKPAEYEYIYFVNVQNWAAVKIYTWTPEIAGWPGVAMTKEADQIGGYDVYSYKADKGSVFAGMLFNNGSGTQTGDLTWTPGKYFVKDKWYTKEEAIEKLGGTTVLLPTVALAGEMNAWSTVSHELKAAEDQKTASITAQLEANTTYAFKMVVDGAWLGNLGTMTRDNCAGWVFEALDGEETNAHITADVAGDYTFTWTYETKTLTVTYPEAGEEPGDDPVDPNPGDDPVVDPDGDVWTVLGVDALGLNWTIDATDNDMVKQADGSYKLVKENLELGAGNYDYKVAKNHSWDISIPEGPANQTLTIETSGVYNVTFVLDAACTTLTATPELVQAGEVIPVVGMHGNFLGTWADTEKFTMAEDKLTASLVLTIPVGEYEFGMQIAGVWTANGTAFTRENTSAAIVGTSPNNTLSADVAGDYIFTWTYETSTLTIAYPVAGDDPDQPENPDTPEQPEVTTISLAGTMNEWDMTANPFVVAEGGQTASLTIALEAATYEFKVVVDNKWLTNTGEMTRDNCTGWLFENLDGMGNNAKIVADVAGDYVFVWSIADSKLSVTYPVAGEEPGDEPVDPETAVDNVAVGEKAVKVIRNGQMYIIRNGVIYNAMGQIAE